MPETDEAGEAGEVGNSGRGRGRAVSWGFMVYGEYPRDIPEV
jgi:hypothetical protein